MRRRQFITALGGAAAAWPLAARAQQGMRRVGVLMGGAESDPVQRERFANLKLGLEKLGWSEGRTVRIDVRFAGGAVVASRMPARCDPSGCPS
jgi:putative tryptophan/tyrosine transport system substrate-binding protein